MMAVGFARLTALLVTTAVCGIGAAEIVADLDARSELRRIVAAHPDLSVKAVRVEPLGGRLILEGVEAGRTRDTHIAIGRLILARGSTGLGLMSTAYADAALDSAIKALDAQPKGEPEAEGGAVSGESKTPTSRVETPSAPPGAATAENVVITAGMQTYRIKRIDVTGTSLSNADLASLLDANSGETFESRFRKVSATSIVVPEILVDDPTAGSEAHASVSQLQLSGVVAGKATAVSVGGWTFQGKTGQTTASGTIGAVQAFGVDFPQTAHVFGTVRTDEAEPIRPLFDSVAVNGMKLSDDKNFTFTVASFKETGVKARPLKSDLLVAAKKRPATMPKSDDLATFADLASSFEVGSIEAVDFATQGTSAKDDTPFAFGLAKFTFGQLAKGKLGGFSMRGIRFEVPTAKLDLASIVVGPVGVPQMVGDTSGPAVAGRMDLDKLDVDVAPDDKNKSNRVKFKLGHAGFMADGEPGEVPAKTKLTLDNIAFDMPADPGSAKPLVDMGYRHLDLSAAFGTAYDGARRELSVRDLSLTGVDMGSFVIGMDLANVTKGIVSTKPNVQRAAVMAMLVKGLKFDVVNRGLVDRAIDWKAKQDGLNTDQEKAQIIEFFAKSLPAQFNSANVKIVGEAIAKFVANPRTLHVSIFSNSGLGAGSMALLNDPAMLIDTLEVSASAN